MTSISVTVNGANYASDVEPRLLLVHYLRDVLGLTGTHVGCDTSQCGASTVDADQFFVDTFATALGEDEILTEIRISSPASKTGGSYKKFANKASHFAIVGVAAFVTVAGGACQRVRIGVTGAGSKATRARDAERALECKEPTESNLAHAAQQASQGIDFLGDIHASEEYRSHLTQVFTRRALQEAVSRAG